jgi:hypothetical protein
MAKVFSRNLVLPSNGEHPELFRRQNVSPAFEGWEKNDDGSFNMMFGYMNRNWEEEVDVPVGPDNNLSPGSPDQGQPTHFQPRRNRFVFKVRVPADWGKKELIWTLTTKGKTEKAYASLREDSLVDNIVQASEQGALGAGVSSPLIRANVAPEITTTPANAARRSAGLTLIAVAKDDGVPRPRFGPDSREAERVAAARARPTHAGGATPRGTMTFDPATQRPPERSRSAARPAFVIRARLSRRRRVEFTPTGQGVEDTRVGANSPWALRWMARRFLPTASQVNVRCMA